MTLYISQLKYESGLEITANPDTGPFFYGGHLTAWAKYWSGVGGTDKRKPTRDTVTVTVTKESK